MICKVKQVAAGAGAHPAAGNLCQPIRPGNPAAAYTATPNLADQAPSTDPKRAFVPSGRSRQGAAGGGAASLAWLGEVVGWSRDSGGWHEMLNVQTFALLTRSLGAKPGASSHGHRAMPGHIQRFSLRPNGTSGHKGHRQAVLRECLLSSRSRVRVAVGAQVRGLLSHWRRGREP